MPIDNCGHTFPELAAVVLPRCMVALRGQMAAPQPMTDFAARDVGPATLARRYGLSGDFPGCYVLLDGERPVYVGISRKVLYRLRQHVIGRGHEDATLAYEMTYRQYPNLGTRSQAMADPEFRVAFEQARLRLRGYSVAFVRIDNAVERHLFEVYCAMALDTWEWNSFETH